LDYGARKKYLKFLSERNEEVFNKLSDYAKSIHCEEEVINH